MVPKRTQSVIGWVSRGTRGTMMASAPARHARGGKLPREQTAQRSARSAQERPLKERPKPPKSSWGRRRFLPPRKGQSGREPRKPM